MVRNMTGSLFLHQLSSCVLIPLTLVLWLCLGHVSRQEWLFRRPSRFMCLALMQFGAQWKPSVGFSLTAAEAGADLLQLVLLSVLCLSVVCAHETRGRCGGCFGCCPSALVLARDEQESEAWVMFQLKTFSGIVS